MAENEGTGGDRNARRWKKLDHRIDTGTPLVDALKEMRIELQRQIKNLERSCKKQGISMLDLFTAVAQGPAELKPMFDKLAGNSDVPRLKDLAKTCDGLSATQAFEKYVLGIMETARENMHLDTRPDFSAGRFETLEAETRKSMRAIFLDRNVPSRIPRSSMDDHSDPMGPSLLR